MAEKIWENTFMDLIPAMIRETGATDQQIADILQVHVRSLKRWYSQMPELFAEVQKARDAYNANVLELSLIRRASGYDYEEHETGTRDGKEIDITRTKHLPPDISALSFFLKTRSPERWKNVEDNQSPAAELFALILNQTRGLPSAPVQNMLENRTDTGGSEGTPPIDLAAVDTI